ncbi:MAG: hypothetical protein LBK82_13185 [Planctomycetaceae bacterium]|jgi:hypothetical protein|nr:hypothetical protein [Planctomycetaceae bacterium]
MEKVLRNTKLIFLSLLVRETLLNFKNVLSVVFWGVDHIVKDKFNDDDKQKLSQLAAEKHLHNKIGFILSREDGTIFEHGLPFNTMETLLKDYPQDAVELLDRAFLNLFFGECS